LNAAAIATNRIAFAQFVAALVESHPTAVCHGDELWEIGGFQPFVKGDWAGEKTSRPIRLFVGKATDWTA
jgi:hypothetical protein